MKRIQKMLLTLMICLIGIFAFAITGEAASKPQPAYQTFTASPWVEVYSKSASITQDTYTQIRPSWDIYFNLPKKGTIKNAKSSNTKVIKISEKYSYRNGSHYDVGLYYNLKKAGTATISFDLSYQGKTYHYSQKIKVVNYENPFKSLKIGKTNYTSRFNNKCFAKTGAVSKKKLSITVKKNWKITKMKIITTRYSYVSAARAKGTTVKNGQNVTLKGKTLAIDLKNTSTGITYTTYIHCSK